MSSSCPLGVDPTFTVCPLTRRSAVLASSLTPTTIPSAVLVPSYKDPILGSSHAKSPLLRLVGSFSAGSRSGLNPASLLADWIGVNAMGVEGTLLGVRLWYEMTRVTRREMTRVRRREEFERPGIVFVSR